MAKLKTRTNDEVESEIIESSLVLADKIVINDYYPNSMIGFNRLGENAGIGVNQTNDILTIFASDFRISDSLQVTANVIYNVFNPDNSIYIGDDYLEMKGQLFIEGKVEFQSPIKIHAVSTVERPTTDLIIGLMIYDSTLNKPIWYDGSNWRDATGTIV